MANLIITKPLENEYAPYYKKYIDLVPEDDILKVLAVQKRGIKEFFDGLTEEQGSLRYSPEKWSVKDILGHLLEGERVFAFRALFFARKGEAQLPGYGQDDWVKEAGFNSVPLKMLAEEFDITRETTLLLFRRFNELSWLNMGVSNNFNISVRTIAYVMAGHASHHINVIKEKYLK
jgi:hypothetical protein